MSPPEEFLLSSSKLSSICITVALISVVVPFTSKSSLIITLPVPFVSIVRSPFVTVLVIVDPESVMLDSEAPPNLSYISLKLSLILSKAVLNGSPVPSLAADPMLIDCCVICVVSSGCVFNKFF